MTQPGVQSQETAQGYTPEELETLLAGVDAAIAAGLVAVAAFIVAQMVLPGAPKTGPGAPFISMDALNLTSSIWGEELDERIMPLLAEMFDESAERVAEDLEALGIPSPPPIADVTAADILGQARNRLVAIGDDLWNNMRTSLAEGMRLGETIPELSARVREAAPVTVPRSHVIARTEAISAANQASITQARSAGVALEKGWEATDDTQTRLAHREADGQWVPLDGMFEVGGELLDIPVDPRGSASNTINCRCAPLYRLAVTTAGFRPQFHTCMGQDGLPPHKGPCRGVGAGRPKPKKGPARRKPKTLSRVQEIRDKSKTLAAQKQPAETQKFGKGEVASVELRTYPDGSKAVLKRSSDVPRGELGDPIPAKHQADAEELASLVGASLGLRVPAVHRESEDSVLMELMDGEVANSLSLHEGYSRFTDIPASVQNKIGLMDALIDNTDRHRGNFLFTPDSNPQLIDHGLAWRFSGRTPEQAPVLREFGSGLTKQEDGSSEYVKNKFTPNDMAEVKTRLEALRPDFDKLGRGEWLDASLKRLEQIAAHATGKKDLIA